MIHATSEKDRELLQGLLSADSIRIQRIYDLALPAVILWVKTNQGTEADARDIFQEALIALYKKLDGGTFNLECSLKSFLRILCRNLWLTRLRDNQKWQFTEVEVPETVVLPDEMITDAERSAQDRIYYRHFDLLGESCRKILMWFFDSVSMSEIASRLDTTESYIKKRKFQCKEQLLTAIRNDPEFTEI